MKILTLLAAVCLMGMASCGQKTCPAYTKAKTNGTTIYAKQAASATSDISKI